MLISLALGFSSYFARTGVSSMSVILTPDVALGGFFLIAYNLVLATVGWANGFALPRRFFYFARAWYCLYLVLACGMGIVKMWG